MVEKNFKELLEWVGDRSPEYGRDLNFVKKEIVTLSKAALTYNLNFYRIELYNSDLLPINENTFLDRVQFIMDLSEVSYVLDNISFCYLSSEPNLKLVDVSNKQQQKLPVCVAIIAVYNLGQTPLDTEMVLQSKIEENYWDDFDANFLGVVKKEEVIISYLQGYKEILECIDQIFLVKDLGGHFFMFNRFICDMLPFFKVFLERMYGVYYFRENTLVRLSFFEGYNSEDYPPCIFNSETDNILELKALKIMSLNCNLFRRFEDRKEEQLYYNVISLNAKNVATELGLLNSFRLYLYLTNSFINNGKIYQKIKESRYSVKEIGTISDVFNTNISYVRELLMLNLSIYINMRIFDENFVKYGSVVIEKIIANNNLLPVYDIDWNVLEFKDGIYFIEYNLFIEHGNENTEKSIYEMLDVNFSSHYYDINYKSLGKPNLFLKFLEKYNNLSSLDIICISLMFKLLNKSYTHVIDPVKNWNKARNIYHVLAKQSMVDLGVLGMSKLQTFIINKYKYEVNGCEKKFLKDLNTQSIVDDTFGPGIIVDDENIFDKKLQNLIFKLYKFSLLNNDSFNNLKSVKKNLVEDIFIYHFFQLGKNKKFIKYKKYRDEIPKIIVFCNKYLYKYYSKDIKNFKKDLLKGVKSIPDRGSKYKNNKVGDEVIPIPTWCYQYQFHHGWNPSCGPKPHHENIIGRGFFK